VHWRYFANYDSARATLSAVADIEKALPEKIDDSHLTPPYWRYLARCIRPFPDFDLFFARNLRKRAVEKLRLVPGDRVLDVGCGAGASFRYLLGEVTELGLVVGVEISPEVVINAQKRIEKNGWKNVQVIAVSAQNLIVDEKFDALLMMGAPDIYGSPATLANLVRYLRPGARFAAFGAKLSRRFGVRGINPLFRSLFSKATFPSTPQLDFEPWLALKDRSVSFNVEERALGFMFLAWGEMTVRANANPASSW
jgi:SAM-dependent methyltransferase